MTAEVYKEALTAFKTALNYISNDVNNKRTFRSVCRETPQDIEVFGLVPTLAFILSKAELNEEKVEDIIEMIGGGMKTEGGDGYVAYLYILLYFLQKYGLIDDKSINVLRCISKDSDKFLEFVDEIFSKSDVIEVAMREYLILIKRLAEAMVHE